MKKQFILLVVVLTLSVPPLLIVAPAPAMADNSIQFATTQFKNRWLYSDKALLDYPDRNSQSWTWGPVSYPLPNNATTESYIDSSNGVRTVQYFDKARMELNPDAAPGNIFEVTTGLLVKELVTGLRQDGDNTFTPLTPATVQVAGDPNQSGANQIAPVYASFRNVITLNGENIAQDRTKQTLDLSINRDGQVSQVKPAYNVTYAQYDPVTHHNIPDVFTSYFNKNGLVWTGDQYVTNSIFFNNPVYIFGLPLTEPYWVRAVVGGVEKDVLVQLFERRTLTYTPTNPDPFKVEMGNVGQHYYYWRYGIEATPPLVRTVTLSDNSQTVTLQKGDTFVLSLGDDYEWTISYSVPGVIERIRNITPIKGSQGVFIALMAGQVTLTASGNPPCRNTKPPCGLPSRLFSLTIIVQ